MRRIRVVTTILAVLAFCLLAVPSSAQESNPKQEAAQLAVSLGFFTYQAHVLKGNTTAKDTEVENALQKLIENYEENMGNITVNQLQTGQLPEFDQPTLERLTKAFLNSQHEFSLSEVDMDTAKQATALLIQSLLASYLFMQ